MFETAYRVLNADEFREFIVSGTFDGAAKDREAGFIHLSTRAQLPSRIEKFRAEGETVYVLAIDLKKVRDFLRWEASSDGDVYPHLYRPIAKDIATVLETHGCAYPAK